jgi:UDPglucose 6-dehydrogenase
VTAKISFANMISELCDCLPGADAAVVTGALAHDSRIGGKYLAPALGFGGPCFPRDNAAFASLARQLAAHADIPEATDSINRRQLGRMIQLVRDLIPDGIVGVLGMSYKPNTAVVEQSPGIAIASHLADAGYRVLIHDPEALSAAAAVLGAKAQAVSSALECAKRSDLLIIATPWNGFCNLPLSALRRAGRPLPVIDCWRLLHVPEYGQTVELVYLGQHRPSRPSLDRQAALAGENTVARFIRAQRGGRGHKVLE